MVAQKTDVLWLTSMDRDILSAFSLKPRGKHLISACLEQRAMFAEAKRSPPNFSVNLESSRGKQLRTMRSHWKQ